MGLSKNQIAGIGAGMGAIAVSFNKAAAAEKAGKVFEVFTGIKPPPIVTPPPPTAPVPPAPPPATSWGKLEPTVYLETSKATTAAGQPPPAAPKGNGWLAAAAVLVVALVLFR